MAHFPYRLTGPIGTQATLGLIVLQEDETVEQDFRRLFATPDIALYVSRMPSGAEITPDTLAEMELALLSAAALFPRAAEFGAVAYACTSGTTLIGAERVAELVGAEVSTRAVTNPLSATFAAFEALGVKKLGIVSPYMQAVADAMRDTFEAQGYTVPATLTFGEAAEARVARIDPASIFEAGLEVGARPGVEAVFLSCTNLRTLDVIDALEARLGVPVVSSNQALAWHMAQLAGASASADAPGRLFRL